MNNSVISSAVNYSDSERKIVYNQTVNEFLNSLKPSYKKVTVKKVLDEFYDLCIKDKKLINKWGLDVSKITTKHFNLYQHSIERRISLGEISKNYARNLLTILRLFCKFISINYNAQIVFKALNYIRIRKKQKIEKDSIISDFSIFLTTKNYASSNNHVDCVKLFLNFIGYQHEVNQNHFFNKDQFIKYEEFLRLRRVKEELAPSSVYQYLKGVRLFANYLNEIGAINFKYSIPKNLIQQSKRSNEYVYVQDILSLLRIVSQTSLNPLRDLSIILIIMETGCRPLEVVNLECNNINLTEGNITLRSKKSGQRILKLSKELIILIRDYILIRENYNPSPDEVSLFVNIDGSRISRKTIDGLFWNNNIKAFGEIKFSPKSLRHTLITNALNNGNNINSVANVVGHKHLCSTLYYFYRDINSLKQQVLTKENLFMGGI